MNYLWAPISQNFALAAGPLSALYLETDTRFLPPAPFKAAHWRETSPTGLPPRLYCKISIHLPFNFPLIPRTPSVRFRCHTPVKISQVFRNYLILHQGWIFVQKIWSCLSTNMGYFETVCHAQPDNLKTVYQRHFICSKTMSQEKRFWNCLLEAKIMKLSNIYPGSETVRHENDRQIAFYSPLYCIKDGSTDLGPVHRNIFARGHWASVLVPYI